MIKKSDIFKTVKHKIKSNLLIEEGDHVILGLSGGADSMCLFAVLMDLKDDLGFNFSAVHVNHMLRGEAAQLDQNFVENICQKTGIELAPYKIDCKKWAKKYKLTVEEAGRDIRYNAYNEAAANLVRNGVDYEKIKIATAHNMDDQAETILMKFLRGSGIDGLTGMEYIRKLENEAFLIRPLLDVQKIDIMNFCIKYQVPYREDKTNFETEYTRNKIRQELIPFIKENFNENFTKTITRNMTNSKKDIDYIWGKSREDFQDSLIEMNEKEIFLDKEKLINHDEAVRNRIIIMAFEILNLKKGIERKHLIALNEKFDEGRWEGTLSFPKSYQIDLLNKKVRLYNKNSFSDEDIQERIIAEDKPKITIMIGEPEDYIRGEGEAVFDYDKFLLRNSTIKDPHMKLIVRTREPGDYLYLKEGRGRKKIQDVFVDNKLPKEERDNTWLVALGREIVWIPEGNMKARTTGSYTPTAETKKILVLKIKK